MPNQLLPNLLIIGVGRAGTTSLFHYLGSHPEICASRVKEINFFTPILYDGNIPQLSHYQDYFQLSQASYKYYLEASPGYFAGGERLARKIKSTLGRDVQVILILREPLERLISHFHYQKNRFHIDRGMDFHEFMNISLKVAKKKEWDWSERFYWGLKENYYADYIEGWLDSFETNLEIIFFDDFILDTVQTLTGLCEKYSISPERYLKKDESRFGRENRSSGYRVAGLHKLALLVNRQTTHIWHLFPDLKSKLRQIYFDLNGRSVSALDEVDTRFIKDHFLTHNRRLSEILSRRRAELRQPEWLSPQVE